MKQTTLIIILFIFFKTSLIGENTSISLDKLEAHPRIMMMKGDEKKIQKMVDNDYRWEKIHKEILKESDKIILQPLPERKLVGKRLLDVSRKSLKDLFFLSYAYRMTRNKKYALRVEKELLAVSKFSDWNPSHFLDVAEMTMGVAIGYDWTYEQLSAQTKKIVENAIINKGIKPSYINEYNNFLRSTNNWNQVCNAGISFGALAIADTDQELAKQTIERAINNPYMMKVYDPNGVYAEGPVYWNYGTSFNVMLLTAIEKSFGTTFGLNQSKGFKETPSYLQQMLAPDTRYFNYSDCKPKAGLNSTLLYFAAEQQDNTLLWSQKEYLEDKNYDNITGNRLLPASLIWALSLAKKEITPPNTKFYVGDGEAPIVAMRTSWTDKKAIYVGVKLGSASLSHGHMDIGSFILVADGVRWASDLGMQEYESLESKGIDLWNMSQNSDRWKVFRYNNMSHNTLTFNNQLQNVKGKAEIERSGESKSKMFVISDLSSIYNNQVKSIKRGIAIINNNQVVVRDEIKSLDSAVKVRWNMLTESEVKIHPDGTASLKDKNGAELMIRIDSPSTAKLRTWSTKSTNSFDESNKGTTFIGFEYPIKGATDVVLQLSLIPTSVKDKNNYLMHLEKW